MRLFAAVWPPDEVLDHLDLAVGALRRTLPDDGTGPVRWSARETWHLTCAFYGDVPDGSVSELAGGLAEVAASSSPYPLRLRGAGVFSHRTLWVGVGGDTAAQQALARAAVAAGEAVGSRPDERPRERAHLTIGRVRGDAAARRPPRGGARWQDGDTGTRGGATGARGPDGARAGAGRRSLGSRSAVRGGDARGGAGLDPESVVAALAVYEGPEWTVGSVRLVASRPGEGRGGGPLYTAVEELAFRGGAAPVAPWAP